MSKVVVRGTSGCGKSTLAKAVADRIGADHVELDTLYWLPKWQERPVPEFREAVRCALQAPRWVVDGNYSVVRDLVDDECDTVVWLDYPRPIVMKRILARSFRRSFRGELCCNGNREQWHRTLGRDSIVWWAWSTHSKRHWQCEQFFCDPRNSRKQLVRLRHPSEADDWVRVLGL